MEFDANIIRARLLYHLRRKRVVGGVHTHFDTLKRGFPKHLGKEVDDAAKNMIKEGLLIAKPTSYGLQVSLNKERMIMIDEFIYKILRVGF